MDFSVFSGEHYMKEALKEAEKAYEKGEIPVGAVVVHDKQIIARAHNMTEQLQDVTAHAEMIALTSAMEYMGSKYLDQARIYVTIEPCAMCAGALSWAQVRQVVYGAPDPKKGFTLYKPNILHPGILVKKGICEEQCAKLMRSFFRAKRY